MSLDNWKNAVVFPYGYEFAPVIAGLLSQDKIAKSIKLISPKGWGICGLDAGEAFGYPEIEIKVLCDFKKAIDGCDVLIIAPFETFKDEKANETINNAIDTYSVLAAENGLDIIDLRIKPDIDYSFLVDIVKEEIDIEVPVIFVSGLTEKVNKLGVLVQLTNSLTEKGYKTCAVGTRHYSDILDMYPFPQFMFDSIIEERKIEMFKSYIYCIQEKESPDVIIVGIPGASLPLNKYLPLGYGIMNYLVSMAVSPDFTVVCAYYNSFGMEIVNDIYLNRYNQQIDCFYVSPTKIFYDLFQDKYSVEYEYLDFRMLSKWNASTSEIPSYCLGETDEMVEYLVNRLGSSECIAVV